MKEMYLIRGIPGSGKSTWAAQNLPAFPKVEADEFFMVDGEYQFDPSKLGHAHADCLARATRCLDEFGKVAVANTFIHNWEMLGYMAVADVMQAKLRIINLNVVTIPGVQVCINRNVHGVPAEIIARMAIEFEEVNGFDYSVDEELGVWS